MVGNTTRSVTVTDLRAIGQGGERPGQVVVARDGRVYASDKGSAVAEIVGTDEIRRIREVVAGDIEGRILQWLNHVLVDASGAMWCSVSTLAGDLIDTISTGAADGYLFRVSPDGSSARIVADGMCFPTAWPLTPTRNISASCERCRLMLCATRSWARRWAGRSSSARRLADDDPTSSARRRRHSSPILRSSSVAWGSADMRDVYIGSLAAPYILKGRSSVPGMRMVHQR